MKEWSDSPIHKEFTTNIFLDTNILAYLIDDTYPSLTSFFTVAKDSPFCKLVCSKYVMFEFVGIRKREHYLRKVAANSKKSAKGEINFSSLTNQKYINAFSAPEVEFSTIIADIKKDVEEEIEKITRDLGIDFAYSIIHDDQLSPAFDICLSSKISSQDSLVLISSSLPTSKNNSSEVVVFTNDDGFVNSYHGNQTIDDLFQKHKLAKPNLKSISNIHSNISLKAQHSDNQLATYLQQMISAAVIKQNEARFLGLTFMPNNPNFPNDCVCFKLVESFPLPQNVYVTVIGKSLDFIYTTKVKIASFWQNSAPVPQGFISPAAPNERVNISFRIRDKDNDNNEIATAAEVMTSLREAGNFVFIHPDSLFFF